MKCVCGHSLAFHTGEMGIYWCEECCCEKFQLDPNWEPPDSPGWEGGFADNH